VKSTLARRLLAAAAMPLVAVLIYQPGHVIDTRTAGMTGSMATANIYFGAAGVIASTQSTIVQLAAEAF